jgi:hypothetical protein
MTVKRIVLSVMTFLVAVVLGSSLISSWNEPQVTGQLQLYQSNLLLQAMEWQGDDLSGQELQQVRSVLLGADPIAEVVKQYQQVLKEAEQSLVRSQTRLNTSEAVLAEADTISHRKLEQVVEQQQGLIDRLQLRLGLLDTQQSQPAAALNTWQQLADAPTTAPAVAATAQVLTQLWAPTPTVAPAAATVLQENLTGWFRYRALEQLYQVQQQAPAVAQLAQQEQVMAQRTFLKLLVIGTLPTLGSVFGGVLLVVLLAQWWTQGKTAVLATNREQRWNVPWNGEVVWQVLIVGFFFVGQFVIPLLLSASGLSFATTSSRLRAVYSMVYYLLMSAGGIAVLVWSIREYLPLPEGWFRFKLVDKWPLWGWGGYLAVLPLMIGVSILNQQLWQGQGGSNPLLQTVLEEHDTLALTMFFLTASIAAPLFEEVLFRGFLLPSLTRYVPVWGAIGLSSLIFATAHLSLSEVLPLTVLGIALGFIYTRSRNLLAPMLLHSTWNSVTMVGLLLLGGN